MSIQLIQGDCLEVMPKLADEGVKVDMVLTDLPYGTTQCKWDSTIPLDKMWECIEELVSDKTPILFFAQQPFTSRLVSSNYDYYKHEWIYHKKEALISLFSDMHLQKYMKAYWSFARQVLIIILSKNRRQKVQFQEINMISTPLQHQWNTIQLKKEKQ